MRRYNAYNIERYTHCNIIFQKVFMFYFTVAMRDFPKNIRFSFTRRSFFVGWHYSCCRLDAATASRSTKIFGFMMSILSQHIIQHIAHLDLYDDGIGIYTK